MSSSLLLKAGVDISRLNRQIRRAINIIFPIYVKYGSDLVVTSTYEGNHSPGSLHYADDAIDIRYIAGITHQSIEEIKKLLGSNFDVVLERDHIHIEYDPKI